MSRPILYALPYSPWSQKARWALAHHGVAFRAKAYLPMLGAPALRMATGRWRGRVTVPCWIADGEVLMDSLAIALAAERIGGGAPLFPEGRRAEVDAWNARSEAMLAAGRALTTRAVGADKEALRESVPQPFGSIPGVGQAFGALGVRFLAHKYAFADDEVEQHSAALIEGLDALRDGLAGGAYLLGEYSYADITMAIALQFVQPTAWHPVGAASRLHWTRPSLVERYADLIDWRDQLVAQHHPRFGARAA